MRSYGQFCSIAKAAEIFCERWTPLVIRNLAAGAHRFSDIQRGVPHMSASLLSRRLRQLEAEGIVERRRSASGNSWTYHLTEPGAEFAPLVFELGRWGRRWTRRRLEAGELDLGLLLWGLEYAIDASALGPGRRVVQLSFTDVPDVKARYWFVCENGGVDICVSDPGGEVDIYLSGTLAEITHVYRGDITVAAALAAGRIEALGPRPLIDRLQDWFNTGPLGEIEAARPALAAL